MTAKKIDKQEQDSLNNDLQTNKMTRKEALKKWGAYSAATMIVLLSAKEAQAQSPVPPPSWP